MSEPVQKETASSQRLTTALREIVQPFIDLVRAPRALWGINLAYAIEGMVYFGILGYLSLHFSDYIFQGVEGANDWAHKNVMVLTAGITLSMVVLGSVADKKGVRFALITAFLFMLVGRALISGAPTVLGLKPSGLWSPLQFVTLAGMFLTVIGYGIYMPAAYTGVRKFATPKTAGTYFIMLYALMNLGGWFPTFAFLLRDDDYMGLGIPGVFWIFTAFTAVALLSTVILLTRRTEREAIAAAAAEAARLKQADLSAEVELKGQSASSAVQAGDPSDVSDDEGTSRTLPRTPDDKPGRIPPQLWVMVFGMAAVLYMSLASPWWWILGALCVGATGLAAVIPSWARWVAHHPLADGKFFFFVFALIPVQTLFTYNWFVLPAYINRAYEDWGWVGKYYEIFSNQNPLLVFILAPIVGVLLQRRKVYDVMTLGTFIMAAPAFLLAIKVHPGLLAAYIVIMTVGEVMWQPRFLQYAAEIAPEGQTGRYVGVAQWPWFLTKMLVPMLYSGKMMDRFCPAEGPKNTEKMWLIFGFIAICSTVLLLMARGWVGRDFKTKAD